jgi:hypothetical protein
MNNYSTNSDGTANGGLGSLLSGVLGAGAGVYGSQNAAEAQTNADLSAITTQQNTMGNINSLYTPQTTLGNSSMNSLNTMLNGGAGGTPDYSAFMNMPGYAFAQQQGQQAGERQAAAMGNAGNSGTAAMIGNQVTGTAMQDYNTYISQLQQAAGLGGQANSALASANLSTGQNISQLQQNTGQAQATGVANASNAVGGLLAGPNGSGIIGNGLNLLGGAANGLSGNTTANNFPNYSSSGGTYGNPNAATDYYDPSTGQYSGVDYSNNGLPSGAINTADTGWDPSSGFSDFLGD